MLWLKSLYVYLVGFFVSFINRSDKVRDFLLWPISTRVLGRNFETTVLLKNGFYLRSDFGDILSRYIIFFGPFVKNFWEPQTSLVLEKVFNRTKGSIIIAGSHLGYFTISLGLWAKRDGRKVYAFEPVSYLNKLSGKNIELNNLEDSVVLKKAALSNEDGVTDIYVESIRSSIVPYTKDHFDHNKIEKVSTVKLDNYFLNYSNEKIGLIFLDVEGYELYALRGALSIIKRDRPYLILEISPKILEKISLTENDMFNFLNEQKYFTYVINDNYRAQGIESLQMIKKKLLVDLKNYFQGREKTGDYYNVLASPVDFNLNDYV